MREVTLNEVPLLYLLCFILLEFMAVDNDELSGWLAPGVNI